MLSTQDIETLELFAFNRLLVRRFDEALPVYELLPHLEKSTHKWQLAQAWCLYHLGKFALATARLESIKSATLTTTEKALFSRLSQLIPPAHTTQENP